MNNNNLEMALEYAKKGMYVIPIHTVKEDGSCSCNKNDCAIGKHPRFIKNLFERGSQDATNNPSTISEIWTKNPDANIGLLTGRKSGVVVLDIDERHNGHISLSELEDIYGALPKTTKVRTGGGFHFYFKHPESTVKNHTNLSGYSGVDVKSDGGYVIAPPSNHKSGNTYQWIEDLDHLAPIPAWLLDLLSNAGAQDLKKEPIDILSILKGVPEGERDDALFRCACKMVSEGYPKEVIELCISEAAGNCIPPFPMEDALDKVKRAYEKYAKTPSKNFQNQALNGLLENALRLDYKKVFGSQKPKQEHFIVAIIEKLLAVAKEHNCHLARQYDFVYLYNGCYWENIEKDSLESFLREFAVKVGYFTMEAKYFLFSEKLVKQFYSSAYFEIPKNKQGVARINLKNGTLEITNGVHSFKPFDYKDFLTHQLPFEYDVAALCPRFLKYLSEVLPDKELQNILQEYLGYILIKTSVLKLEKCLVLYGEGQNGKSVLFDIVNALLGENNVSNYSLTDLNEEHYRAMIKDKILNYASEFGQGIKSEIFKQLVSGEKIGARLKYKDAFTMEDYAKLMFNTNELPREVEHNKAYFRRFLIMPFEQTISDEAVDPNLAKTISSNELSGIFNWVLEGLSRIIKNKEFSRSTKMNQIMESFKKDSDSTQLYLDEYEYHPADGKTYLKGIYEEYTAFCKDDGYKPLGKKNFSKRLERLKFVKDRDRGGFYFNLDSKNVLPRL